METILLFFIIACLFIYAVFAFWHIIIVCGPAPENGRFHTKIEVKVNWKVNRPPILYYGLLPLLVESNLLFYWIASILGIILVYLNTSSLFSSILAACFFLVGSFVSLRMLKIIALFRIRKHWRGIENNGSLWSENWEKSSTAFPSQNVTYKPKSYEEAYSLSYDLLQQNPEEALNVINYIYRKNLPVKESDIFFVNSIASLALMPIYRKFEIGKRLLEKVIATKKDDFTSNSTLINFALMENNIEETKRYAVNLLSADYNSHIKTMEPASKSRLPMIRNYMDGIIDLYQNISNFFLENGDKINARKAMDIVENIKSIKNKELYLGE